MIATLSPVSAIFVATALLLLGNGLQSTLVAVRAGLEGFPTIATGIVMSMFYLGWVAGSARVPVVVARVGHIRTFAALAAIGSSASIGFALLVDPWSWAALRAASGFALAGLYVVIESWLNDTATNENRGRILSAYMIVALAAMAVGQQLLTLADPKAFTLFAVICITISMALVPVTLTKRAAPVLVHAPPLGVRRIYVISPLAVVGLFAGGLVAGSFWGMAPVFAQEAGFTNAQIANLMSVAILGGILLQWPIGRLSDKFDRRSVILLDCFALTAASAGIAFGAEVSNVAYYLSAALFGGALFTLYSLCVAHANDHLDKEDMVQASGSLLLVFGVGAALGPFVGAQFMALLGPAALYLFTGSMTAGLGVFAIYRMKRRGPVPSDRREPFVALNRTSAVAFELDPRHEIEPVEDVPASPGVEHPAS